MNRETLVFMKHILHTTLLRWFFIIKTLIYQANFLLLNPICKIQDMYTGNAS